MDLLKGKTAIVSGAAGGIGRAAALLFVSEGAKVTALDIMAAGLEDLVREAPAGSILPLETDLVKAEDVKAAIKQTIKHFGGLQILFNVAGISGRRLGDGPTAECSEEAWDTVLNINLKSQFLTCKYALQHMLQAGGGSIINLSSVLGLVGGDEDFATHAYAASKGGIISLTRAIAAHYAKNNIRANVICPGLIATGMSKRAQADEHIRARLSELQPLGADFGRPEDVAQAALYLASESSRFVTGSILTVDGGWTVK